MANKIMTNIEFVDKLKDIVNNYKTLYIMGCFGAPMNDTNKQRYKNNNEYNKTKERQKMIDKASADTFGFDCVNLIKGVLWGWNGNQNAVYGGATYASNGLSDLSIGKIVNNNSYDDSYDFSNIEIGELVYLYWGDHIGVYIGDGLVIECTPNWKNKVQITACLNIGAKKGYNGREWYGHCKFNFIDYTKTPTPPKPTPYFEVGKDYKLLIAKCIRRTPNLSNNILKVKQVDSWTKQYLTSKNANANAMLKVGFEVTPLKIVKENGRIWGSYGNCFVCLCNADGTKQCEKVN